MYRKFLLLFALFSIKTAFSQFQMEPPETIEHSDLQSDVQVIYENAENNYNIKSSNIIHPSLLVRYGISDRTELQINLQFLTEHTKELNETIQSYDHNYNIGIAPVKTGLKFMFNDAKGLIPSSALLVNLSIPGLASSGLRLPQFAPEIIFTASHYMKNFSLGYNTGLLWDGESSKPTNFYIMSLSYAPIDLISLFMESYGYYKSDTHADNRLDAGISFFLPGNLQVDLAAGIGLSEYSPLNFIGAGLTYRLPKL
ncbi:MAG: transporter [Ignavibacteriae bacterium]|nr:MAG: transporter [Ignavibacteriota bacterium]